MSGKTDSVLKEKIKVAIQYLDLLNLMLEVAMKSLVNEGEQAERSFVESFCSYAYFRIPIFQKSILDVVCRNDDPEITEWRDISFNLKDNSYQDKKRDRYDLYSVSFDWERNFYKYLTS